ncbi:MAG: class Ib ribonucleoside-diphosphate reductase assembly flavoprotein NrdI [Alphaproteobacteria bacterium]|jgi:protein involved in ribonucleotide reduction|nr:class Ib ribonucleoside-diphosphate reductase assembly flavoprotein NrdI [Alphaproteobacteria bacterium]
MLIVYASKTGNIIKFLKKSNVSNIFKIETGSEVISENFVLITYTTGIGELPLEVATFLKNNHKNMIGVIGSGNKNWGGSFCNATNIIQKTYKTPILLTFEMAGNKHDIEKFLNIMSNF